MKSTIPLVIADSTEVFIEGIRSWTSGIVNIELFAICRGWDELTSLYTVEDRKVLVVTQCRWVQNVESARVRHFLSENKNVRMAAFCSSKKRKQIYHLMEAGVCGFFNPGTGHHEFIQGLIELFHDQNFISAGLRALLDPLPSRFSEDMKTQAIRDLYISGV